MRIALMLAVAGALGLAVLGSAASGPNYNRDVAPILDSKCASCHRLGGIAPFSLTTAADAKAHADGIVRMTKAGLMPPWMPSDDSAAIIGRDKRRLTSQELATLAQWAANGAPAGNATDRHSKPSLDAGELTRSTDALRRCHARLVGAGIDPAQFNAQTAAQDVVDLMVAMNIRRANFVAFEGIDAEVFSILRSYPAAVRSLTLDNPPPPGTTILSDPVADLSGAFGRYVALCNADPICTRAYPNLGLLWQGAFTNIQTQPQVVPLPNPDNPNGPKIPLLLDGFRGTDGLGQALGDPNTYSLIPAAIAQTTGQPEAAAEALQADFSSPTDPWGAAASFQCAYDVNTLDRQAQALEARTLPQFVRAQLLSWATWCDAWKVPNVAPALSQPIVSDVPVLMFRGDLAPAGNPSWLPDLERGLSNAQSVVFPTLGRDLLANGPPCLSALRRAFLADPTAKLDTAACAQQSPRIRFVAPIP